MTKQQIIENMSKTANIINNDEAWNIVNNCNFKMKKHDLIEQLNKLTEMLLKKRRQ